MLPYVMIGMMCNSLGCYWADIDNSVVFNDGPTCARTAKGIQQKSIMYFDTGCRVWMPTQAKAK